MEAWRKRPLEREYPYVFVDGIWLKRAWGGRTATVSVLVAIGMNRECDREDLGVAEASRDDRESGRGFLQYLKHRGLERIRLLVPDRPGLLDALYECCPDARWQRCVAHFNRNVQRITLRGTIWEVSPMFKAIHAQEDKDSAHRKAEGVARKQRDWRLERAARIVCEGCGETQTYHELPSEHCGTCAQITRSNSWLVPSGAERGQEAVSRTDMPRSCWQARGCDKWLARNGEPSATCIGILMTSPVTALAARHPNRAARKACAGSPA